MPGLILVRDGGSSGGANATAALLSYMVATDILMLILRGPCNWGPAIGAIAVSSFAVFLLFPLSWFATPNDYVALTTHKWRFIQVSALTILALTWPAHCVLLNYIYTQGLLGPLPEAARAAR